MIIILSMVGVLVCALVSHWLTVYTISKRINSANHEMRISNYTATKDIYRQIQQLNHRINDIKEYVTNLPHTNVFTGEMPVVDVVAPEATPEDEMYEMSDLPLGINYPSLPNGRQLCVLRGCDGRESQMSMRGPVPDEISKQHGREITRYYKKYSSIGSGTWEYRECKKRAT